MSTGISYPEWKRHYFLKGRSEPIYTNIVQFIIIWAMFIDGYLTYGTNIVVFIEMFMASIISYSTFTDQYAHMIIWKPGNMPLRQYISKIFHFRTHDIWGQAIVIVIMLFNASILGDIVILLSIVQILGYIEIRFYH